MPLFLTHAHAIVLHSEPCIRGHRSTKCEHFLRYMVRVRRPGRPSDSGCPHYGIPCHCAGKERVIMVRVPMGRPSFPCTSNVADAWDQSMDAAVLEPTCKTTSGTIAKPTVKSTEAPIAKLEPEPCSGWHYRTGTNLRQLSPRDSKSTIQSLPLRQPNRCLLMGSLDSIKILDKINMAPCHLSSGRCRCQMRNMPCQTSSMVTMDWIMKAISQVRCISNSIVLLLLPTNSRKLISIQIRN